MTPTGPILKWPGGKRSLAETVRRVFDGPPPARYIEPFVGGGAVYFARLATGELKGRGVVLADAEPRLMAFYRAMQTYPGSVQEAADLRNWSATWAAEYYSWRDSLNQWEPGPTETAEPHHASLFLWMNRACFNGLYRVNAAGEFNAPVGAYAMLSRPTSPEVARFGFALSGARLLTSDAVAVLDMAGEGDQVYCDPPYHREYDQYTRERFSWDSHVRLAEGASRARARGVFVVISNAATPEIRAMYGRMKFEIREKSTHRSIAAAGDARGQAAELLAVLKP